jgi:hypothetical protein
MERPVNGREPEGRMVKKSERPGNDAGAGEAHIGLTRAPP